MAICFTAMALISSAAVAREPFYLPPETPLSELTPHYSNDGGVISYKISFKKDWSDAYAASLMIQNGEQVIVALPVLDVIQQTVDPFCFVFFHAEQGKPTHGRLRHNWKLVIKNVEVVAHSVNFLIADKDKEVDYVTCSLGAGTDGAKMTVGDFNKIVGNAKSGDWMEFIRR